MRSPQASASITVDLDTLIHYRTIHGLPNLETLQPDVTYLTGVSRLLDLFDEFGIKGTLFVIGADADVPEHKQLLQEASDRGHELGNHTFSHWYDLRSHSTQEQIDDIAACEEVIASVTGETPRGFRTPGYNVDDGILRILKDRGYTYDSSVLSAPPYYLAKALVMAWRAVRSEPSGSQMTLPSNLAAPSRPYWPSARAFWKKGTPRSLPLEIPMCTIPGVGLPIIGTSLHMLGARGFDAVYPLLRRAQPTLFQLEFHAIDFVDLNDEGVDEALVGRQPDLRVPWTRKRALYEHVFTKLRRHYQFQTLEDAVDLHYRS